MKLTNRRGVAAVECALVLPFFMATLLTSIEIGSLIRIHQKATLAAREAAGYAAHEKNASLDELRLCAMNAFWDTATPSPKRDTLKITIEKQIDPRTEATTIIVTVKISFQDALWPPLVLQGFQISVKSVALQEF